MFGEVTQAQRLLPEQLKLKKIRPSDTKEERIKEFGKSCKRRSVDYDFVHI